MLLVRVGDAVIAGALLERVFVEVIHGLQAHADGTLLFEAWLETLTDDAILLGRNGMT